MSAGQLRYVFLPGYVTSVGLKAHDEGFQFSKRWKEVGKLLDGKYRRSFAVISDDQALWSRKIFGHQQYRAFGVMKGLLQVIVGLILIDVLVKQFTAQNEQIGEAGFGCQLRKCKDLGVFVNPVFDIVFFALLFEM